MLAYAVRRAHSLLADRGRGYATPSWVLFDLGSTALQLADLWGWLADLYGCGCCLVVLQVDYDVLVGLLGFRLL